MGLSTTFLLADINEKCESASNSKHQENYLQSLTISFKHLLSTTFLLADMNEKCESASKRQENYLHLSSLAQTIQFWPVSGEKKMPSTPVYDKDGLEKCSGTNPREILVKNRLFKHPQIGGRTSPDWRTCCFKV